MSYCKKCENALPEGAKYCPNCGTSAKEEGTATSDKRSQPAVSDVTTLKLAFWSERFVAWLIDVVILGVVVGILGLFAWFASITWWSGWPSWLPFFNFNLSGVIYFLYWMLMDGLYGQSFGKMAMRIKVTRLDGNQINMGASALESVGKAFLLPLDCLLGWLLYPKRRQRIFNYISETIVVKVT
jgi:uncharacterized RDD family membrane protein YckC